MLHSTRLCIAIISFILFSTSFGKPIEFKLNDGTLWQGDTETLVKIKTNTGLKIVFIENITPYNITVKDRSGNSSVVDRNNVNSISEYLEDKTASTNKPESTSSPKNKMPVVCNVSLTGTVGCMMDELSKGSSCFSAKMLEDIFYSAKKKKAIAVILEITSQSGNVAEANSICNIIQDYRTTFEIIAFPHRVEGPACQIVMSCTTIVAAPDSSIGPDETVSNNKQVNTIYKNANREVAIANAFGIKEVELWYTPSTLRLPSVFSNAKGTSGKSNLINDNESSLVLKSAKLLTLGLANKLSKTIDTVYDKKHKLLSKNSQLSNAYKKAKISAKRIKSQIQHIISETYDKKHNCKPDEYCVNPHPDPKEFTLSDMMRELMCRIKFNQRSKSSKYVVDTTKIAKNIREIITDIKITAARIVISDLNDSYPFQLDTPTRCVVKTTDSFGEIVLDGSKIIENVPRVDKLLERFTKELKECGY